MDNTGEETLNVKKVTLKEDDNSLVKEKPGSDIKSKEEPSEKMNVDEPKSETKQAVVEEKQKPSAQENSEP